ncbi:hypothetical protein THASP1DRAFT_29455 [Thamnocephalis sphaerospora]|uniref:Uncharacterized protein n=1 Tax=Thamnocephalis sphaerospora TaxID=78915 RepID=A0A4P9XT83_9FUNG|nr:hypothetical protein THASP1DRAFT_29455 [Thamnocephalis sphaerospora]|eukprot:RKP08741.1 hypothetical protein THASP1DRAFT_29455 [Thamnocephalis sphaerospora]
MGGASFSRPLDDASDAEHPAVQAGGWEVPASRRSAKASGIRRWKQKLVAGHGVYRAAQNTGGGHLHDGSDRGDTVTPSRLRRLGLGELCNGSDDRLGHEGEPYESCDSNTHAATADQLGAAGPIDNTHKLEAPRRKLRRIHTSFLNLSYARPGPGNEELPRKPMKITRKRPPQQSMLLRPLLASSHSSRPSLSRPPSPASMSPMASILGDADLYQQPTLTA